MSNLQAKHPTELTEGQRKPNPLETILAYQDLPDYLPAIGRGIQAASDHLHEARMHLSLMLSEQNDRETITASDWPEAHRLYDDIDELLARIETVIPPTVRSAIEEELGEELELVQDCWTI